MFKCCLSDQRPKQTKIKERLGVGIVGMDMQKAVVAAVYRCIT